MYCLNILKDKLVIVYETCNAPRRGRVIIFGSICSFPVSVSSLAQTDESNVCNGRTFDYILDLRGLWSSLPKNQKSFKRPHSVVMLCLILFLTTTSIWK